MVLAGVLVNQQRSKAGTCAGSSRLGYLASNVQCKTEQPSSQAFGFDPVFLTTSALYNPSVSARKQEYYNGTGEISELGTPFGFHHVSIDRGEGAAVTEGFPVYFDVNLQQERAQQLWQYMKDGFYLDGYTEEAKVSILLFNPTSRLFGFIRVVFKFDMSGHLLVSGSTDVLPAELYSTDPTDVFRLCLELMFVLVVISDIVQELKQMQVLYVRNRHGDLSIRQAVLGYFGYFTNWVDCMNLGLSVSNILTVIKIGTTLNNYRPRHRYEVYADVNDAEARFLKLSSPNELPQMLAAFATAEDMAQSFQDMHQLATVSIMCVLIRMLGSLDFQPRLGLVTRTLKKALVDLAHWGVVFLLVLIPFACLAWVNFGSDMKDFSTVGRSMYTMWNILFEGMSMVTPLLDKPNYIVVVLFFVFYFFLTSVILLNVLLAILVDAFADLKDEQHESLSVKKEWSDMYQAFLQGPMLKKEAPKTTELLRQLSSFTLSSLRLKTKEMKHEGEEPTNAANFYQLAGHINWMYLTRNEIGDKKRVEGLSEQQMLAVVMTKIDQEDERARPFLNSDKARREWDKTIQVLRDDAAQATKSVFARFSNGDHTDTAAYRYVQAQERAKMDSEIKNLMMQERELAAKMDHMDDGHSEQMLALKRRQKLLSMRMHDSHEDTKADFRERLAQFEEKVAIFSGRKASSSTKGVVVPVNLHVSIDDDGDGSDASGSEGGEAGGDGGTQPDGCGGAHEHRMSQV
jgi:hypothetical protein